MAGYIKASDYLASFAKKKTFNMHYLSFVYGNGGCDRGGRGYDGRGSWYRGGRGHVQGCRHGTKGIPSKVIQLEAGNYSNNEWSQLTDEQKDKTNKPRKAARDNKHKM
eukprot:6958867-Ditylum_brightwellii.AAC.2